MFKMHASKLVSLFFSGVKGYIVLYVLGFVHTEAKCTGKVNPAKRRAKGTKK